MPDGTLCALRGGDEEASMQPDQLIAQLVAELLGIGAFALVILWQPRHSCRWEHCPHHGKTVKQEIRLERELHERDSNRGESDR
jgi:hypothetical protein